VFLLDLIVRSFLRRTSQFCCSVHPTMKRALAERAKQNLARENAAGPPSKLRRLASSPETAAMPPSPSAAAAPPLLLETVSSSAAATIPTTSNTTNTTITNKKRQRPDLKVPEDASAFYLVHQNRALAVEWRDLNDSCLQLTQERELRRRQCRAAAQALAALDQTWTQLETSLQIQRQQQQPLHSQQSQQLYSTNTTSTANQQDTSPHTRQCSTGTGESVEWTLALTGSLVQLGEMTAPANDHDAAWMEQCAAQLVLRAERLQAALFQRENSGMETSAAEVPSSNSNTTSNESSTIIPLLQAQVSELTLARSAVVASERRLRRNAYRLAAGMMTLEQFVQGLDGENGAEQDEAFAAQLHQQQQRTVKQEATDVKQEMLVNTTNGVGSNEGSNLSAARSNEMRAQLENLELLVANRNASIESVSGNADIFVWPGKHFCVGNYSLLVPFFVSNAPLRFLFYFIVV
jgi:hypothetical protein